MAVRKRTKKKDVDVTSHLGFVADKAGVHGTPSDTDRKSDRGAYAASSVIERGTAAKLRDEVEAHFCVCGCGQTPSNSDSLFMPGHDSKVRAMGKAVLEGKIKKTELPKPALTYLLEGGMLA